MNIDQLSILEPAQFVKYLGHHDWQLHEAAYSALFRQGQAALDALIDGLAHPNWRVRMWCADLMDHLADDRCAIPLQRTLRDPSPHVRRHAVHSLGCQRCKSMPLMIDIVGLLIERALTDTSLRVRRVAVHQLGLQTHDPRIGETLQTILSQEADEKLLSRARYALHNQQTEVRACSPQ